MAVATGITTGSMWKYFEGTHSEVAQALEDDGINHVNGIQLTTNGTGSIVAFAMFKTR